MQLKVAVVGAGIGGLAAATALRREGHIVEVFEQSELANETGAAINIMPNANSVLQQMGVDHEEDTGTRMTQFRYFGSSGELMKLNDFRNQQDRWQAAWLLGHRAHLHSHLKRTALSTSGSGTPVTLHTSSRVISVDPTTATIFFEDGKSVKANLVVGADGVRSKARTAVCGKEIHPITGHLNAFRFMLPVDQLRANEITRALTEPDGSQDLYFMSDHRKVVVYPCQSNMFLNFVFMHRAGLTDKWIKGYSGQGSKTELIEIFKDAIPSLIEVQKLCPEQNLKIFPLVDMETLPTFVKGRVALIGDAAHPFTPHLGQGAGMAIEDSAALSTILRELDNTGDIPERLELYNKARYERATTIQEFSRQVGREATNLGSPSDVTKSKGSQYMHYGFSHDEYHASAQVLRQYLWENQKPQQRLLPWPFGPQKGIPKREGCAIDISFGSTAVTTLAKFTFKTSATLLRNLFPSDAFSFVQPDTATLASWMIQTSKSVTGTGTRDHTVVLFEIHGVQYRRAGDHSTIMSYCPIGFQSRPSSAIPGDQDIGWPILYSDIAVGRPSDVDFQVNLSWNGILWASCWLHDLRLQDLNSQKVNGADTMDLEKQDDRLIIYENDILGTDSTAAKPGRCVEIPRTEIKHMSCSKSSTALFRVFPQDQSTLPVLNQVINRLAELPIIEIVEASLHVDEST